MTSNALATPADACSPDADRAGPAMPENIARILYVVRVLLEYGRHLAATIERRAAAPGFWLFSAVFGTARLPVIAAHLHRGILRATALESLLLQRAAAGRDVAAAPLHGHAAPSTDANTDPCNEPFEAQVARLTAERAQHDAPVDPDNLSAAEQIEAEVRVRPIGRTIADIRRDLGIVAMMCTRELWDALTGTIACYEDSAATVCVEDVPPETESCQPEHENDPEQEQKDRGASLDSRPKLAFEHRGRLVNPFRPKPTPTLPRHNVPVMHRRAAVAANATGPPLCAAMKRAA